MDAAHDRAITSVGKNTPPPTIQDESCNGPVRVRPDLMVGLGVAARLARLTTSSPIARKTAERMLRTERLVLRPMTRNDRVEFLRVLRISRAQFDEFCPLGSSEARTDEAVFERQLMLSGEAERTGWHGHACRLLALTPEGQIVAGFNVNDIERGLEHTGELVFWVSVDVQRRGYAEEGVRAMMGLAFAELPLGLGLDRVSALIAPGNEPCRRLALRLGLRLGTTSAPVELTLGDRRVTHDVYEAFAKVGSVQHDGSADGHFVEGKPSVASAVLGHGVLRILRTED